MSFEPIRRQSARHDPFAGNAALMLSCPPRCPPQVHAALIVVLTRGGSTARLVAKYRPSIPVLTVAVPVLTTDSLTWTCSGEQPARQCLVTRGLLPLLAEGSARATDTDTTDEMFAVRMCGSGVLAVAREGALHAVLESVTGRSASPPRPNNALLRNLARAVCRR